MLLQNYSALFNLERVSHTNMPIHLATLKYYNDKRDALKILRTVGNPKI